MVKRHYPCDSGDCPYDTSNGNVCRNLCGYGVEDDAPEEVDEE